MPCQNQQEPGLCDHCGRDTAGPNVWFCPACAVPGMYDHGEKRGRPYLRGFAYAGQDPYDEPDGPAAGEAGYASALYHGDTVRDDL